MGFFPASLFYVPSSPPLGIRTASFLPIPLYSFGALQYYKDATPYSLSDSYVLASTTPTFVAFSLSMILYLTIKR